MKAFQAMRHLRDVDLSRFGGVPISQHMRVSGSQMLHVNTFMAGRVPPAARLDAHLRRELPAAAHADPVERFLCVLKAHIALLDAPANSLRKPFNPVLGETSRIVRRLHARQQHGSRLTRSALCPAAALRRAWRSARGCRVRAGSHVLRCRSAVLV